MTQKRNGAKRSLVEPLDIAGIRDEKEKNMRMEVNVPDSIIKSELFGMIDQFLPVSFRSDFKKMMEGVSIGKQKREKVIEEREKRADIQRKGRKQHGQGLSR